MREDLHIKIGEHSPLLPICHPFISPRSLSRSKARSLFFLTDPDNITLEEFQEMASRKSLDTMRDELFDAFSIVDKGTGKISRAQLASICSTKDSAISIEEVSLTFHFASSRSNEERVQDSRQDSSPDPAHQAFTEISIQFNERKERKLVIQGLGIQGCRISNPVWRQDNSGTSRSC